MFSFFFSILLKDDLIYIKKKQAHTHTHKKENHNLNVFSLYFLDLAVNLALMMDYERLFASSLIQKGSLCIQLLLVSHSFTILD